MLQTDGRAYFEMADAQTGDIQVKAEPDFELLQTLNAVRLYLNVSASVSQQCLLLFVNSL